MSGDSSEENESGFVFCHSSSSMAMPRFRPWRELPNFPTPNENWPRWPLHSGGLMQKLDAWCGST